jgi:hypothetical protein
VAEKLPQIMVLYRTGSTNVALLLGFFDSNTSVDELGDGPGVHAFPSFSISLVTTMGCMAMRGLVRWGTFCACVKVAMGQVGGICPKRTVGGGMLVKKVDAGSSGCS